MKIILHKNKWEVYLWLTIVVRMGSKINVIHNPGISILIKPLPEYEGMETKVLFS